jgi:hypothetical protein
MYSSHWTLLRSIDIMHLSASQTSVPEQVEADWTFCFSDHDQFELDRVAVYTRKGNRLGVARRAAVLLVSLARP